MDEQQTEFKFANGLDYIERPRPAKEWIVEPLLSPGALINIYGAPKAGKSRLGLSLAMAISSGQEYWLDRFKIHTHGPVLWLEVDNSPLEWVNVLKAVAFGEGKAEELANVHFADRDNVPYPFDLLDEEGQHDVILAGMIEQFVAAVGERPVLIIIDTIRECHSGDENDSTALRNVITKIQAACGSYTAIGLISHSRKDGGLQAMISIDDDQGDTLMDDNRGSNYLVGKMQTIIRVTCNQSKGYGYFTSRGREIGVIRFKMRQKPPAYLWYADSDPAGELVRDLRRANPDWSDRRIAKEVAEQMKMTEEAARSLTRRVGRKAEKSDAKRAKAILLAQQSQ